MSRRRPRGLRDDEREIWARVAKSVEPLGDRPRPAPTFEGPKAVRAAMGGLWDVALARVPDLGSALDGLAASGAVLWGAHAAPGESVPVGDWRPGLPSALVMGSEAHGLSACVRQRLAGGVWIPGGGREGAESLNVAVAAGVLMQAWTT